ncbi:MAG: ROK family transcriptional regulator [Actinobacteria bacterium]|nr:ROK family transcriptional regulator [Actinomycetota bacterium]MBM3712162.1 ROK family transcriptional regulator [Actinomycetota bacterium]
MENFTSNNLFTFKKIHFVETIGPKFQNIINESIVLNYLRENSNLSRAIIAKSLNISAPTVSKIIDNLIKNNFVIETEKAVSSGGKRATTLVFNKDIGFTVSVDLSKGKIIIAQTDFEFNIKNKYTGFKIIHTDEDILNKIIDEIKFFLGKFSIDLKNKNQSQYFKNISIGVPANVDRFSGRIISAPLFKNWLNLNLKEHLENVFNVPVFVENIVNLSAIGENHFGAGKKISNLVFIELSNGIGAGIIIENNLFNGSTSSAGEIGFTINKPEDLKFKYKIKGKLEKELSIESIEKRVVKLISEGKKTKIFELVEGNLSEVDIDIIFRAAVEGDVLANEIINEVVDNIAITIINIILILNPQLVVIGGQISSVPGVEDLIIKPLKKIVKNILPFDSPEIKISMLGANAGILGASFMAVDSILGSKFPYKIANY